MGNMQCCKVQEVRKGLLENGAKRLYQQQTETDAQPSIALRLSTPVQDLGEGLKEL